MRFIFFFTYFHWQLVRAQQSGIIRYTTTSWSHVLRFVPIKRKKKRSPGSRMVDETRACSTPSIEVHSRQANIQSPVTFVRLHRKFQFLFFFFRFSFFIFLNFFFFLILYNSLLDRIDGKFHYFSGNLLPCELEKKNWIPIKMKKIMKIFQKNFHVRNSNLKEVFFSPNFQPIFYFLFYVFQLKIRSHGNSMGV